MSRFRRIHLEKARRELGWAELQIIAAPRMHRQVLAGLGLGSPAAVIHGRAEVLVPSCSLSWLWTMRWRSCDPSSLLLDT